MRPRSDFLTPAEITQRLFQSPSSRRAFDARSQRERQGRVCQSAVDRGALGVPMLSFGGTALARRLRPGQGPTCMHVASGGNDAQSGNAGRPEINLGSLASGKTDSPLTNAFPVAALIESVPVQHDNSEEMVAYRLKSARNVDSQTTRASHKGLSVIELTRPCLSAECTRSAIEAFLRKRPQRSYALGGWGGLPTEPPPFPSRMSTPGFCASEACGLVFENPSDSNEDVGEIAKGHTHATEGQGHPRY